MPGGTKWRKVVHTKDPIPLTRSQKRRLQRRRAAARREAEAQAASDKQADSQTEEAVATIAEVQHQEQPQAGGPAQEAAHNTEVFSSLPMLLRKSYRTRWGTMISMMKIWTMGMRVSLLVLFQILFQLILLWCCL